MRSVCMSLSAPTYLRVVRRSIISLPFLSRPSLESVSSSITTHTLTYLPSTISALVLRSIDRLLQLCSTSPYRICEKSNQGYSNYQNRQCRPPNSSRFSTTMRLPTLTPTSALRRHSTRPADARLQAYPAAVTATSQQAKGQHRRLRQHHQRHQPRK